MQHRPTRGRGKGFVSGQTALTPCWFSSPEQHRDGPLGTSRTPLMHAGSERASRTSCTPTNTRHTQHIPRTRDCPRTDADRRASGSDRPRTLTSETGERLRPSEGMGCDARTYITGTDSSWHSACIAGERLRVRPRDKDGRTAPPTLTHAAPINAPLRHTAQDGRAAPSERKTHTHATLATPSKSWGVSRVLLAGRGVSMLWRSWRSACGLPEGCLGGVSEQF